MGAFHTVIGGGPLGQATAQALLGLGKQVRLVQRSPGSVPPGADLVRADIRDAAALRQALSGSEVAYFCAQPPYTRWLTEFQPLLDGVTDACAALGLGLVSASNLYMHAGNAEPLTEQTPEGGDNRKGRLRSQMDARLLAAHKAGLLRAVVARAADFFGPGVERSVLGQSVFVNLQQRRSARIIGDPDQAHSYCYVPDFGRALAELGQKPAHWGRVWHVPHSPAQSTRQLLQRAADLAGQPLRLSSLGAPGLYALGLFVPILRETIELLPLYTRAHRVDDSEWQRHFDSRSTPVDEALSRTLAAQPHHRPLGP
jgi:nucleoside-diphosphate-sugar epimerase